MFAGLRMGRRNSPYTYGGLWLDRRKDGKAKTIWQIGIYNDQTRSTTYRSTKEHDIEYAIKALRHYADTGELVLRPKNERQPPSVRSRPQQHKLAPSDPLDAPILPQIMAYWTEHGCDAISKSNIAASIRHFTAFCVKERLGSNCTFNDVTPQFVRRYIKWRMAPHSYKTEWLGKKYNLSSKGVSGRTVKGEIADIKAALNYAVQRRVVPYILRIPRVPTDLILPPRIAVATVEAIGSMIAFAQSDPPLLNWLLLMLASGARPTAAMKMVPSNQFEEQFNRLDLHPLDAPLTKKRNALIPVIPELAKLLRGHEGPWVLEGTTSSSLNRKWRLMVDALDMDRSITPYVMRHSVASHLTWRGADPLHVSRLLGHSMPTGSSASYIPYSPNYMSTVTPLLSKLWIEAHLHARFWSECYCVVNTSKGGKWIVPQERFAMRQYDASKVRLYDTAIPLIENRGLVDLRRGRKRTCS
jgi:integrase